MKHRLKRKSENWRQKLNRPVILRDGKTLRTLSDCRSYILDLDEGRAAQDKWQRAAEILFTATVGGDLDAVSDQFERILIHENKIKLT